MTRLLIVTQVFPPSTDALSQLLADLTSHLALAGFDVHVLTSSVNYTTGELLPLRESLAGGISVWRTPALPLSKFSIAGKIAAYGSFWVGAWPALVMLPRPDVVLYQSTPPLLGLSSPLARRWHGARTVLAIQDVYPELPVRMGSLQNPLAVRGLGVLEAWALRGIDHVVVLGERMQDIIVGKGVSVECTSVIHNWSPSGEIVPRPRDGHPMLEELGLSDRFVVQYSGNMGVAHDMSTIMDAARRLRDDPDIRFLMIGDGRRLAEVEGAKRQHALHNVQMLPFQPKQRLPLSLTAADVALVTLRPELEGLAVPSKFYGILAAGVPVVFIGAPDGEFGRIINREGCGIVVQDGDELAYVLRDLRDDPKRTRALGAAARRTFEQCFARERSLAQYTDLMIRLTAT